MKDSVADNLKDMPNISLEKIDPVTTGGKGAFNIYVYDRVNIQHFEYG
ncbi:hypothetical protein [Nostoc sp. 'Lobaria pulmonaria (5183) cyanobiont']|nr:hypothetical protein [Nostoc sp. 'Lobaria pulmonaria (5183) cyanobiont']